MAEQVMSSFNSSLAHLHTDEIDSYVLHGPSLRHGLADQDWAAWEAMEDLHTQGKVKALGVSNMSAAQLKLLLSQCRVAPRFIQNRCFARLGWDREVRQVCEAHEITYQGFSLLTANREVWESSALTLLAQKYQCSQAEIIFSFALALKMLPLTGTSNPDRMSADLKSHAELLSDHEIKSLEAIY
jgi:diketogulonate reductase-like aldo/keto reductase